MGPKKDPKNDYPSFSSGIDSGVGVARVESADSATQFVRGCLSDIPFFLLPPRTNWISQVSMSTTPRPEALSGIS